MTWNKGAIETWYDGIEFRSRLEARWAVFFNMAGVDYLYEPEAFDLGDLGRYLPDFYLPTQRAFLEVKGTTPSRIERDKCLRLAEVNGSNVYLVWGAIQVPGRPGHDPESGIVYFQNGARRFSQWFGRCPRCGCVSIREHARLELFPCSCWDDTDETIPHAHEAPVLLGAYRAARSFRF